MTEAHYLRIAGLIRDRIHAGDLRTGDRVPSTREIIREWGVAMATATKVLGALRQEGLVEAVPGVGTVVARPPASRERRPAHREQVVAAAIAIADTDGLAALSMRRVAAALGMPTMTLYGHVAGKEELLVLMTDAAFAASPLPSPAPDGWRRRLETVARLQWSIYRRHPWAAEVMSFTRPPMAPHAMAHTEWVLAALDGTGLPLPVAMQTAMMLANHARGTAVNLEWEAGAEQDSGVTNEQWFAAQMGRFGEIVAGGDYPMFVRLAQEPPGAVDFGLDTLFEFGLARLLDGLTALIPDR
ncbi:TetR/AcrR family transcriptional regulator C-terminal domain-containing protein [Dactylosporangium sp. NPDC049525]|uniref:TetR/AcrR family transcriptional regulator C-terminal domain-containing protein n=1 Tax=Dactylosporangium sp. NPDC049525 TaxID=3154730 RepID=UPI00342F1F8F